MLFLTKLLTGPSGVEMYLKVVLGLLKFGGVGASGSLSNKSIKVESGGIG